MSGDPLTDPRCKDLLGADPSEISALAVVFSTISSQAETCVAALGRISHAPDWSGSAADAMRSSISSLNPHLRSVGQAYSHTASALSTYEGVIAEVQPQFKTIKASIESTQASVNSLTSTYNEQKGTLDAAQDALRTGAENGASAKDLTAMHKTITADGDTAASTGSSLSSAQSALTGLQARGMTLLQEFSDARDTVKQAISSISHQAPKESWLDKALGDVENFVDGAGKFFANIGKGAWHTLENIPHDIEDVGKTVVHDATSLPDDVTRLIEHPTLKNLGTFGEDLGVTVGATAAIVGLAAGGAEVLAAGGAADAAATGAGAALDGVADGAADATAEAAAGDADGSVSAIMRMNKLADRLDTTGKYIGIGNAGVSTLQGRYGDAAVDLIGAKVSAANAGGFGDTAAAETERLADASEHYAKALADGATPAKAFSSLDKVDQAALNKADSIGITPASASAAHETAESAAKTARLANNLAGRPTDVGVDELAKKPAEDHAKAVLSRAGLG